MLFPFPLFPVRVIFLDVYIVGRENEQRRTDPPRSNTGNREIVAVSVFKKDDSINFIISRYLVSIDIFAPTSQ